MCLNPIQIKCNGINSYRWLRGERSPRYVLAPCGKCLECLSRKQNDLAARLYQESKTKSRMFFVTFTYRPSCEPYAGSIWRCEKDTGSFFRLTEPMILDSENPVYKSAQDYFKTLHIPKSGVTRIFEEALSNAFILSNFDGCGIYDLAISSEDSDLYLRVTPSLNFRDPRLAIKRWRVQYERVFGKALPEFSYCLVGEFGTKCTRRPHYHMVILSNEMEKWQVDELVKQWNYGRTEVDIVRRYNSNGSDGFSAVSRYIGKYVSKGPFDVDSVRQGLVKGSRICTSKHLGQTLTKNEIDFFTCQDMKKFNQELAFKELSEEDSKVILPEIVRRLKYRIITKKGGNLLFSMPQSLQKQIFNYRVSKTTHQEEYSSLYYMVKDFILEQSVENCSREFEQFRASRPRGESICKTVSLYEKFKEVDKQNRYLVLSEGLQRWYNVHSKF